MNMEELAGYWITLTHLGVLFDGSQLKQNKQQSIIDCCITLIYLNMLSSGSGPKWANEGKLVYH